MGGKETISDYAEKSHKKVRMNFAFAFLIFYVFPVTYYFLS